MMKAFDLFISLGTACRPAQHLKENALRFFSSPLDWQMGYSLDTVIDLFSTQFASFFLHVEEQAGPGSEHCRRVLDYKNNIVSIHSYPKDASIESVQQSVYDKMQSRYQNLHNILTLSSNIAFICNRADSKEVYVQFLEQFSQLYPHLKLRLINIANDSNLTHDEILFNEHVISHRLAIDEYTFNDSVQWETGESFTWKGNIDCWNLVLNNYSLNKCSEF